MILTKNVATQDLPHVRLRRLRTAAGLTLQGLASKAGLSKSHLSKMETNYDSIMGTSYRNLCKIAAALNTSVPEVMEH